MAHSYVVVLILSHGISQCTRSAYSQKLQLGGSFVQNCGPFQQKSNKFVAVFRTK